jgi:RNA polymerase sigma factor (sigma-70 family)
VNKVVRIRRVEGRAAEMSDEALLAACATGDQAALAALFDRHHTAVLRFVARAYGVDGAAADDVLQVVFLEIYAHAGRFESRSAPLSWMFGIAANIARKHLRSRSRRAKLVVRYGAEVSGESGPAPPDRGLERRQKVARLEKAVSELPEGLREAFILCDAEGVSGVEAARILGLKEGTLYRRLHDARRRLRAALGTRMES